MRVTSLTSSHTFIGGASTWTVTESCMRRTLDATRTVPAVTEQAERYRRVAAAFSERVDGVGPGGWDAPAPCDGWVARDVVRHMVEWFPSLFLAPVGISVPATPSVDDDPAGAWHALDDAVQGALDDPELASMQLELPMGTFTLQDAVGMLATPDVLMHTWDLARATGQDERLDADEVASTLQGMLSMDESLLRDSGHYGPRVEVPDDADEQTKLIAYSGRRP